MSITNVYVNYLKLTRFIQISRVLIAFLWKEMLLRSFYGKYINRRQIRAQKQVYSTQERLRFTIERLGPTYVKFGQILADRPDVISERFREQLKKLQSTVQPFDNATAIQIIEDELREPISSVFESFDRNCLAAASIGQVYQARLKDGTDVIVKVQRPNIEKKIKLDLYLMKYLASRFANSYPELAALNIVSVVDEFGESIIKELDYYNEASNMIRFGEMFKESTTVYVPKVYMEYTTKRVMVQERIYGLTPDSKQELIDAGLNPETIARNGADALLTMIMRYGFFHADPHAGNMFIMKNNVIGLIDFGMVGVLRPRDMEFLANITMGFLRRNEVAIADALITLCGVRFFEHRDELIFRLQQMVQSYAHIPLEKLDFSKLIQECISLITKYGLQIPTGIFMLAKSLATIQKVAENLDPHLPFAEMVKPYAKDLILKKYSPKKIASDLYDVLKSYASLVVNLPDDVSQILYKAKMGEITHNIKIEDGDLVNRSIRSFGYQMSYAILLVGLFIGAIILQVTKVDIPYSNFLIWVSSILIFLAILKWLFRRSSKARKASRTNKKG